MHPRTRSLAPLAFAAGLVAAAAPAHGQEIRYGPESALGEGTVRTYLLLDAEGRPAELGIAIDPGALGTLPAGEDFVISTDPMTEAPFLTMDLPLPEGHGTPLRFVMFDWNPKGHPPFMYELAHFDFHFYLVDPADRDAIVAADVEELEARGGRAPEVGLLPANYVYPGQASIPKMGGHWIDPASHEFHGQTFDRTFIYGTWDGRVIFIEPMVTRAFIEAGGDTTGEIALPARYPATGWFPTAYRVYLDGAANEHRIALVGFAQR